MDESSNYDTLTALSDFRRARLRANTEAILARLAGEDNSLLSYEDVRKQLRAIETQTSTRQDIPLDAIVGSVGRQRDFTRNFLPKNNSDQSRWAGVKKAMLGMTGVPPIEVYQLGEVYFVKDGNHRVSVAREMGLEYIEAYVTPVQSNVTLSSTTSPDELIIKSEYADFLEQTGFRKLCPDAELDVSIPGQYSQLLEHINVHHYYMGLESPEHVSFEAAVKHWYSEVYLPVVELIRERGLMQVFPDRTVTDLYLWLAQYRAELGDELGFDLPPTAITRGFAETLEERPREERVKTQNPNDYLAENILVAIPGTEVGWCALEQALHLAKSDTVNLYGIHVVATVAQLKSASTEAVEAEFKSRCAAAGIKGQFTVRVGNVTRIICERARWVDIVVANLVHPPATGVLGLQLSHGFGTLLRRCPRPILAVPDKATTMRAPLLGYDGSSKSKIALFAAAYLCSHWGVTLTVLTVVDKDDLKEGKRVSNEARNYLEAHGVSATYSIEEGAVVSTLLNVAAARGIDLLIFGGYEYTALLEPLLGGVLDNVLRQSRLPMLICQ